MKCILPMTVMMLVSTMALAAGKKPAGAARCGPTQLEMNEEAGDKFKKADAELNRVYAEIRRLYADDRGFLLKLRAAQRLWLKFRDAETEAMYPRHNVDPRYYGSFHPVCCAGYRTKLTEDRVAALKAWLVGIEEGELCSGSIKRPEELKSAR